MGDESPAIAGKGDILGKKPVSDITAHGLSPHLLR
jgi:hypothetical protein